MSYTPTEWASGDVITAEKLNKIESGIESASSGGSGDSSPVVQIIFNSHNQQVGTNYTGTELLSMNRQETIQIYKQEEIAGVITSVSSVWIGQAQNDYGGKLGLSIIFIKKGTSNIQFDVEEYYVPNNDTTMQYLRDLSFES